MGRLALGLLLLAGCYAPRIDECAFGCGPGNKCPEGFSCNMSDMRCYSKTPGTSCSYVPNRAFAGDGTLPPVDLTNSMGSSLVVNTITGEMKLSGGMLINAIEVVMPNQAGFTTVKQSNGPDIALWNFTSLIIPSSIGIQPDPSGTAGTVIGFAATDTIDLNGKISLKGYGKFGGSAGVAGGVSDIRATPAGFGTADSGGGGAGYAQMGGDGMGGSPGKGGQAYGDPSLLVVHVGGGGGGGGPVGASPNGGRGGNGGGALALYARKIHISGEIDVDGTDGGTPGTGASSAGGGGGGAGGSISISADQITFDGSPMLHAKPGMAGSASPQGGSAGGAASPGIIWIGGRSNTTPSSEPPAQTSSDPATELPRTK